MRSVNLTALALCAMAMCATAANAADDCASMATQVKSAMDSNQQSSNLQAATKEKNYGRDFCNNGLPKVGVVHYAQALKLLGAS